jgi:RHS repeat-associated protein
MPPQPIRTLQDTISGTIGIDATPVTLTLPNPGDTGELTFNGTQGQRVFFKFTNNTIGTFGHSQTVDMKLFQGATELFFESWLALGTDSHDTYSLPTTGPYTIQFLPATIPAQPPNPPNTGSITTTLYEVPADWAPTLVPSQAGDSTTFTTAIPGQNAAPTFQASQGQRVFVYFTNNTFSTSCLDIVNAWLEGEVGLPNPVGVCPIPSADYIDTVQLAAGAHTLKLDPERWLTGSLTATIYDVPADAAASLTLGGPSQNLTIPVRGQGGRASFSGSAGQPVTIKFTNITITQSCTYPIKAWIVDAANPDGPALPNSTTNVCLNGTSVSATLPANGSYLVRVDPNGGQVGSVTLTATADAFQAFRQTYGVLGASGIHARVASVLTADPVNSLTGAFTDSETDLSVASNGVAFAFTRSYTSADPTTGRLGVGWTDPYAVSLIIDQQTGDVLLHGDEGQQVSYAKQPDGSFVGAPGTLSTLALSNGTYNLVRHDQATYTFNSSGVLQSELDQNGQGLTFSYDGSGRLSTVTDASGHTITLGYNGGNLLSSVVTSDGRTVTYGYTSGRLSSVTLPDPDGPGPLAAPVTGYSYDSGGRLATVVDPNNHTQLTNVYDQTTGRVTQQTDANNKTTNFAWDAATQTATATDPNGHVWKDVYSNNVLLKQIDGTNRTTLFSHSTDLDTTAVTSTDGVSQTTMTYDGSGNLLTARAPASLGNAVKTFTYDAKNNITTVTDARNKQTVYGYDPAGNLTSVTLDGQPASSATYDGLGRMLTSTDGNGKTTTYAYDGNGNIASVTGPDPDAGGPLAAPLTTFTHDVMGHILTKVDPLGNCSGCTPANYRTTFTYDANGNLLTETDPLGNVTTQTYDAAGNETSTKDANNHTTTYEYDNANQLTKATGPDPDGAGPLTAPITTYEYDNAGNRWKVVGPRGNAPGGTPSAHTTTYTYDENNRLASVTTPKNETTTYSYDANGNRASVVEPRGNVQGGNPNAYKTTYTYDAAGRLLTQSDPLSNVTTNHYDDVGNLAWSKDANNHQTNYTYDAAGRILTVVAPDNGVTTYTYDPNGNLATKTDAKSHQTTYSYDGAGHLTQVTGPDPDGVGPLTAPVTTYTYDLNSNLVSTIDANGNATPTVGDGKTTLTYDRANRPKTIAFSDTTPGVTFNYDAVGNRSSMVDGSGTLTYAYDALDRLASVTRGTNTFSYVYDIAGNVTSRTYPDATQTTYSYDEDNRLSTATSGSNSTGYEYDAASNLIKTTLPAGNGYVENRSYDNAGRLTEVKSVKGTATLADFTSTLDGVGNPTAIAQTGVVASNTTYTYDANDRLTSVCFQTGSCPGSTDPFIRWTYDSVGNRLTETRPPASQTTYTYNARDQLTQAGTANYTYDQNGNQKSAGSRTFTYDLANRLKTTTSGSTTTTYTYDGEGNRLQASTGTQASKKTNYLWDTNRDLPQLALERDGNNALIRRYIYGARRISMRSGTSDYYFHYDSIGSVRNLTNAAGLTQWTHTYEPFGALRSETKNATSAPDHPIKFVGELLDPTNLYYLRARQYDSSSGRFLRTDPVPSDLNAPQGSSYAYATDRPTVFVDPSGETKTGNTGRSWAAIGTSSDDAVGGLPKPPKPPKGAGKDIRRWVIQKIIELVIYQPEWHERPVSRNDAYDLMFTLTRPRPSNDPRRLAEIYESYLDAFTGKLYLENVDTGWRFVRYYNDRPEGPWLTRTRYRTPAEANAGLALPNANSARCWQYVTINRRTLSLRGHITNGDPRALQWFVFSRGDLRFGACQDYPAR